MFVDSRDDCVCVLCGVLSMMKQRAGVCVVDGRFAWKSEARGVAIERFKICDVIERNNTSRKLYVSIHAFTRSCTVR